MTVLSPLDLAQLVVRHFPPGVVPQTGHGIRETAYAVASAESGRWVEAEGDDFGGGPQSFGLWQVYLPAHPEYSPQGLRTAEGAANAAYDISNGGLDWNAWCTWEPTACGGAGRSTYLGFLPEAGIFVAQATGGGAATGIVAGAVSGPYGAIAGAALSVQGGPTGYSGPSGAFTLTGVAAGQRLVTVSAPGYLAQSFVVDVVPSSGTTLYPALAAAPGPGPAPAPAGAGSALLPVLLLAGGILLATTLTRQPQITIIKKLPPGALPPGGTLQKAITLRQR